MERFDLYRVCSSVFLFFYVAIRTLIIYIDKTIYIDPHLSENFYLVWERCFNPTLLCSDTLKRVPSNSSMSSVSGSSMTVLPETTNRDFDTVSIESCGLSPLALQSIREQMAISLERTKLLEDQVKLIPQLKVCFTVFCVKSIVYFRFPLRENPANLPQIKYYITFIFLILFQNKTFNVISA